MNDETPHRDAVMNLRQAAAHLGIHSTTLNSEWKHYGLPPTKMGGRSYWFVSDLDAFIAKRVAITGDPSLRGRLRPVGWTNTRIPTPEEFRKAREEQAA